MREFGLVTFDSEMGFPVSGTVEAMDVVKCRVTCIVTASGLEVDFVSIPELSLCLDPKSVSWASKKRFVEEAFEHMDYSSFVAALRC